MGAFVCGSSAKKCLCMVCDLSAYLDGCVRVCECGCVCVCVRGGVSVKLGGGGFEMRQ